MKALTIWQPWASLIMAGGRPYEFRRWAAPPRLIEERIVIHASAHKPTEADLQDLYFQVTDGTAGLDPVIAARFVTSMFDGFGTAPLFRLPRGAGLGTALLGRPVKCTELWPGDSEVDTRMWPGRSATSGPSPGRSRRRDFRNSGIGRTLEKNHDRP